MNCGSLQTRSLSLHKTLIDAQESGGLLRRVYQLFGAFSGEQVM